MRAGFWSALKWGCLGLSVGSIVGAGALMWVNEGAIETEPSKQSDESEQPQANVEKPLIVERKGERIIWRLQAESAKQQEQGMHLIDPKLELFTEQGEAVPVRAKEAWFEAAASNIRFKGDTVVDFRDWKLESDELKYDSGRDEAVVPGGFRMFKPGTSMWGDGLRVERKSQRLIVERNAKVEDSVYAQTDSAKGQKVLITSDALVIEHRQSRAEFHGAVHLKRDDFDLRSDRLVVIYRQEMGGEIERAEAYGHVVMQQDGKHGSSDSAIYRQKTNELEMIGNAEVEDARGSVRGERLIHHIDTKMTTVEQGEMIRQGEQDGKGGEGQGEDRQRVRMIINEESEKP